MKKTMFSKVEIERKLEKLECFKVNNIFEIADFLNNLFEETTFMMKQGHTGIDIVFNTTIIIDNKTLNYFKFGINPVYIILYDNPTKYDIIKGLYISAFTESELNTDYKIIAISGDVSGN